MLTIVRIEEEDFGCEGRMDGEMPKVTVYLEDEAGECVVVTMDDALMYARGLDEGVKAFVGPDGSLYKGGALVPESGIDDDTTVDTIKMQNDWMDNYYSAVEELEDN